jgi:hypothetical protein
LLDDPLDVRRRLALPEQLVFRRSPELKERADVGGLSKRARPVQNIR